jgi:hypothetical protein
MAALLKIKDRIYFVAALCYNALGTVRKAVRLNFLLGGEAMSDYQTFDLIIKVATLIFVVLAHAKNTKK